MSIPLTPQQKHRYAEDLIDRLDLAVTVDALRQRLRTTDDEKVLRRKLGDVHPRAILLRMYRDAETWEEREDMLQTMRRRKQLEDALDDRQVTRAALADAEERLSNLDDPDNPLDADEQAFLESYEQHVYQYDPKPTTVPCLEVPGPAKVPILIRRAESGKGLWNKGIDTELTETAPDDGCEYDPVHAKGNCMLVGRTPRLPSEPLPERGKRS